MTNPMHTPWRIEETADRRFIVNSQGTYLAVLNKEWKGSPDLLADAIARQEYVVAAVNAYKP